MRTADSNSGVCARIARRVEASVGARRFSMWFDRSARFDYFDHQRRLEVRVPNQFVADWIGRNFQKELLDALQTEVGGEADLTVQIDTGAFDAADPCATIAPSATTPRLPVSPRPVGWARPRRTRDAGRYTLEDFVVGPGNELAFEMARRLADESAGAPTTLFIHGSCAVGKTHLLQAAARHYRQMRADKQKVRYLTAEQFTNEFLTERRAEQLDRFRKRIRRLDFLAIDDIDFLANKPGTQREFMHAIDEIEMAGGRVLMTAHDHPRRLPGMDDKLVSRCLRGMVMRIDPPDTETRVRIVRSLAARRGIPLAEAIASVIASRCRGSIREIEGSLTKLHALANLTQAASQDRARGAAPQVGTMEIGHALVERLFAGELESAPRRVVRLDEIVTAVCDQLGVTRAQVLGGARHKHVVLARSLVCHLAREMTSMSYPEIAAALGRRTHSTIIAAARRMETLLKRNPHEPVKLPDDKPPAALGEVVDQLRYQIARAQ